MTHQKEIRAHIDKPKLEGFGIPGFPGYNSGRQNQHQSTVVQFHAPPHSPDPPPWWNRPPGWFEHPPPYWNRPPAWWEQSPPSWNPPSAPNVMPQGGETGPPRAIVPQGGESMPPQNLPTPGFRQRFMRRFRPPRPPPPVIREDIVMPPPSAPPPPPDVETANELVQVEQKEEELAKKEDANQVVLQRIDQLVQQILLALAEGNKPVSIQPGAPTPAG